MKTKHRLSGFALSMAGWLILSTTAQAGMVFLNFNSVDTYTGNFTNPRDPGTGGGPFVQGDTTYGPSSGIFDNGGLADGGVRVTGAGDQSNIYNVTSFDLTSGPQTISAYVKSLAAVNANQRPLQLGFINSTTNTFNGDLGSSFLSVRVRGDNVAQLQIANNGTTDTDAGIAFGAGFTQGDWLKLTFNFSLTNAGAGTITYSYTVDDYGVNGTSVAPINLVSSPTLTKSSAAFTGTSLSAYFAGWRSNVAVDPGIDNFAVNVPEPASLALLGLASTALLTRRRRG